jgi:hypothetical protein
LLDFSNQSANIQKLEQSYCPNIVFCSFQASTCLQQQSRFGLTLSDSFDRLLFVCSLPLSLSLFLSDLIHRLYVDLFVTFAFLVRSLQLRSKVSHFRQGPSNSSGAFDCFFLSSSFQLISVHFAGLIRSCRHHHQSLLGTQTFQQKSRYFLF